MWQVEVPEGAIALGYRKLIEMFNLKVVPHFRWSYVSLKWEKRELYFKNQNITLYIYPPSYKLSDNVFKHLEFALKYEGVNLYIIKKVLSQISPAEITKYIQNHPMGRYARILWYFYENLENKKLLLPDLKQGSYLTLLNPEEYYCSNSKRSPRHRIADNLLGNVHFAPVVRKTILLNSYEEKQIEQRVQLLTNQYEPSLVARAMRYLYTKETMSSWEIEREKPDHVRLTKFTELLHRADLIGSLSEEVFIALQKDIVDSRFSLNSYRDFQNYVGEEPGMGKMIVHYIAPKPENVRDMMSNLIGSFERIETSGIDPVIAAAIVSFLFVYIHPFEDGNGRIHRFLIHYVLARLKFTPVGIVFPVSAVIARDMERYDRILELFSKPLMDLITEYKINHIGTMEVFQDTQDFYRYLDCTPIAEYLYECVEKTITTDFREEIEFLADYDNIKRLCKDIVDMPDQRIDLFIKCVRQNAGTLSSRKREDYFSMLTDEEIREMEVVMGQYSRKK